MMYPHIPYRGTYRGKTEISQKIIDYVKEKQAYRYPTMREIVDAVGGDKTTVYNHVQRLVTIGAIRRHEEREEIPMDKAKTRRTKGYAWVHYEYTGVRGGMP